MKILHIHFYLLVFCGAAECFTEKSVDLGQNVTLKCEVSVNNVYWFLMKASEPPVFILRSFFSISLTADYSNTTFNKRFSLQYNSSLFIHNISTNELGVYYCIYIQKGSSPNISRGIRLYIQSHSAENQTEVCQIQTLDKDGKIRLWRNLFIITGLVIGVVMVAVTELVIKCKKLCLTARTMRAFTIIYRCLLFFMVHLLIHNVLVQSIETREAFVGHTVILPCSIDRTVVTVDVFWRDDEQKVLVDIIKSKEVFSDQSPEYRDRVQTFQTEIANGNFSIKLSNVTLYDSGTYTCHPPPRAVQSVKLSVKEGEKKITPRNGDITIRASSLFLLGFSLLYSLDF
ncbi:uncharacterized protein LOC132838487 [Tachysurus vachellii]|uniref:uncharacterized protein LOC132838487 n=1 Tax=Tachysurus vachellii TaxID=175792 RepID=UPI00296AE82E|nr:uncharacterized protein LOC132838487 [Tachysurus vachellii]